MKNLVVASTYGEAKKYAEGRRWTDWQYVNTVKDVTDAIKSNNADIHLTDSYAMHPNWTTISNVILNNVPIREVEAAKAVLNSTSTVTTTTSNATPVKANTITIASIKIIKATKNDQTSNTRR